ncbi:Bacterial regulatory protein, arsR family [compost metagenome]
MPGSSPFPTYSGLLEPKHYKRIGQALWLFLWCVSSTTREEERDGETLGIVLDGRPMKLSEVADHFGIDEKTVSRQLKALEQNGYIRTSRAQYGVIIEVRHSKREDLRTDINVRSENSDQTQMSDLIISERTNMSTLEDSDRTEMSDLPNSEQTNLSDLNTRTDINVRSDSVSSYSSFKDLNALKDLAVVVEEEEDETGRFQKIRDHFVKRRNAGFEINTEDHGLILQIIKDIPVDFVIASIDKAFFTFKPKHRMDKINTFKYIAPRCYDDWVKHNERIAITENVPSEPVALGYCSPVTKPGPDREVALRKFAKPESTDKTIEYRNYEIAFNRHMNAGGSPDDFVYTPDGGTS